MPQRIIAANWKMNPPPPGWDAPHSPYETRTDADVIVFPTVVDLKRCIAAKLQTGAQCGRGESTGAFTGDVSMQMLVDLGCTSVLCGHSERRKYHGETDLFVAECAKSAIALGMTPIVCVGETLEEREAGREKEVLTKQLLPVFEILTSQQHHISVINDREPSGLAGPDGERFFAGKRAHERNRGAVSLVIAYEPVWAIGTGRTATPEQAQAMHAFIRSLLPEQLRALIPILYGGSVKAVNAKDLMQGKDIDGFLVGGASLLPDEFASIINVVMSK